MKKFLFIVVVLCWLMPQNVLAQKKDSLNHKTQTRFNPGLMWRYTGLTPRDGKQGAKYDRLSFDVFYNTWIGQTNKLKVPWYSIGFNTNLMFDLPFNPKSTCSFGIGLSFSHINIHHEGMLTVDSTKTYTQLLPLPSNAPSRRLTKFAINYFQIPIEFRFRTPGVKHFKFYVGAFVGVRLNSYERWKIGKDKFKEFNYPDVNWYNYGVTARIGIRNWSLFASYSLSSLFSHSRSPQLSPLCLGITISLF